ncbi:MAG TPA: hypothetical protein VFM29_06230, partial [Vicinamibacteria bacterium]|nr:hypothetical protein [Vicinamibacteria bacterium]
RTISLGARYVHKQIDHAVETVLTADAAGNDAFLVGNPGFGLARDTGFGQALPKAVRDYDALELTFDKRMAEGWLLHASYLWSRLHGNYTGLAREAEGTPWPNNSDAFDHPSMLFGQDGQPVIGPLAFDRPHQLKAHVIREFATGTTIGASARAMSGTPVTRTAFFFFASDWYEVPYLGRNSDGRLPPLSQVDLYLQHEFQLARGKRLQLSVNVINLFDQDTTTLRYPYEFQDAAEMAPEEFFRGFDMEQVAAEQGLPRDPMFLMDYGYQLPREIRLGLRFTF